MALFKILSNVKVTKNGCWEWQRALEDGYGTVRYGKRMHRAHRLLFIKWHKLEDIKPTDFICHKCDNRKCVNPDHLYLGNAKTNNNDTKTRGRLYNSKKTHCKRGHEFIEENTHFFKANNGNIHRYCRTCKRIASRKNL